MLTYAGIGSRNISSHEQKEILGIAHKLSKKFVCYSGNANGADITFQTGSDNRCVIFMPWEQFNVANYNIEASLESYIVEDEKSLASVDQYHPAANN